jgi:transcriptional regulator with XRE-family HTH domain
LAVLMSHQSSMPNVRFRAAVEQAIKRLGSNLRTARLRRNLTIEVVGEKIGTGPRAVSDAEKGKISTGIAVYTVLLWAYDLLAPMEELADPALDEEGLNLSVSKERARARIKQGLDNDFQANRKRVLRLYHTSRPDSVCHCRKFCAGNEQARQPQRQIRLWQALSGK